MDNLPQIQKELCKHTFYKIGRYKTEFTFRSCTKRQLLDKMYDIMEPGGYLFIGRTETIERGSTGFRMLQPSIFRKPEGKR